MHSINKKKIFVIAGEISGDNIAYNLLKHYKNNSKIEIKGIGGDNLKKIGVKSIFPMDKISIMGIIEIIPKIPLLISLIRKTIAQIIEYNPDLIVTIDSPDFCFRISRKIKNIKPDQKILHVVAPTVWAWKSYRAKKISKFIDHLFVLYPFEKKFFLPYKINTTFIGHPLIERSNINKKEYDRVKIVSVYPGSREREIKLHLKEILTFLNKIENIRRFTISIIAVDNFYKLIQNICEEESNMLNIKILTASKDKMKSFKNSHLAIAVSGTITFELAMNLVPVICVYKLNNISFLILKFLVKVKFISLVNIINNKRIIPELIQNNFNYENFSKEFLSMVRNKNYVNNQKKNFLKLRKEIYFKREVVINELKKILSL